jgi:hypothetical protein
VPFHVAEIMDTRTHARQGPVTRYDDADRLRQALAPHVGGAAAASPDCLDDHAVAALADGSIDAARRDALLPHLAGCAHCRHRVASVARALADPGVARELSDVDDATRPRVTTTRRIALAAAAAAAAVLLVIAWPSSMEPPQQPHRAPAITAAPAPEAVWPVGAVADARSLRWSAVPGADRYRVTLFDAEGLVLFEAELAGTEVELPAAVVLDPGRRYWWEVDARLDFDRWVASDLVEFSIAPESPR